MSDPLIGQTLERYQIVSQLGVGQLGDVYKAYDLSRQREVALKLIRLPEGRTDLAEAILRPARLAAQLDQPGLIKVLDSGRSGEWVYISLDYLAGDNLAQLLQDLRAHHQWLPLAEAVGLVRQLALVFDQLGREGRPPRGFKPADVMLKAEPFDGLPFRAVLTSLGLEPEDVGAPGGWPPNPNAPTPAFGYWPPEKTLGAPLDARSEVYALGVLLYELAVGSPPFLAQSPAEATRLHTQTPVPLPRSRRADLPPALEGVILKALEKERANRYADPAALALALSEVMPAAQAADRNPANSAWTVSLLAAYQRGLSAAPTQAARPVAPAAAERPRVEAPAFFRFNGTVVDANLVQTSPDGSVGVYVDVPQLTVIPGQPTSTGLFIVNLGPALEHFSLSLSGLPAGWLAAPPPASLPLAAGESRRVTVTVAPPRAPESRAGRYALVVRVARQSAPDQVVEAKLALTVAAFAESQIELNTTTLQAGVPARLLVHNQGNTSEAFAITFDDPEAQLLFDPPGTTISVPEGQVGAAVFTVKQRGIRVVGGERVYPLAVRVAGTSSQSQTLTAEVMTRALIPAWMVLLALFACCVVAGGTAVVYNGLRQADANTATAAAQQTGRAVAQQTISAVGTQLATRGTNTPTATPTGTLAPATITGTFVPSTPTLTPAPSDTAPPATASGTAPPATSPAPPPTGTDTATAVPPSPTATVVPPTATSTLAPSASPTTAPATGGRMIYVAQVGGQPNIFVANGDGSGATPLTTNTANQNPTWSAAAQRIAFESARDGNSQIYSMRSDGTEQTRLTNDTAADTAPVWSTDGAHIAFVSNRDGNPEIYVMNADGSQPTRLTNNAAADTAPAWDPDNTHLAFISERDGNPEVYLMDANGSNLVRLTNDADPESEPSWAPNGAWLAYVRGAGAQAEIYLTTASGSGQLRLTNNALPDTQPRWAPNGSRLAFVSERDGNAEIYTMLADGSAQTRLTNSAGRDDHPVWSPAGDRLAFATDRDGVGQVYVMNADGSAQTRLTNDGVADIPGIWLP